jgi:hypothetical protein
VDTVEGTETLRIFLSMMFKIISKTTYYLAYETSCLVCLPFV